jgi:hypothetical protein
MKKTLIAALCLAMAGSAAAQDPFSLARDLYASASYEEALTALTRLHDENASGPLAVRVDQYRAFCLFALGRTNEARSVAESLISDNPLLALESDASPRIAALFTDVRKRLIPTLIRDQYRSARAAVDKNDFAAAEPRLVKVRQLLDEASTVGVSDETMADLGVLVDGFLDLARKQLARASESSAVPVRTAPGTPADASAKNAPAADAAGSDHPRVFDSASTGITVPVAIRQTMPALSRELVDILKNGARNGVLEVTIDERGSVERAVMREPVQPMYDSLLMNAARSWKYQPAMKGSMPVKYVKVIAIAARPAQPLPQQ